MTIFVAVIMVIVLGVVAFTRMTPDLLPNMDLPYAMVLTTYAGQTPETVEKEVTKPLEQSLAIVDGVKQLTSQSAENYSLLIIEFNDGTMHHVVYEGDLTAVLDDTTLSADTTINIEGAEIVATNYGDLYEVGMQNWYIEVKKDDKVILLDVFSASTTDPSGVYQVLSGAEYANKFIPGFMNGSAPVGAWYGSISNGKFKVIAPMVDGVIQIKVLGNTATINFGVWDDGGNLIDGSASGAYSVGKAEE